MNDSPYKNAYIIKYPDGSMSLQREEYVSNNVNSSTLHTVMPGETLPSIAFKFYGDSGSWYRIADVNNIFDPWEDLTDGLLLNIPL